MLIRIEIKPVKMMRSTPAATFYGSIHTWYFSVICKFCVLVLLILATNGLVKYFFRYHSASHISNGWLLELWRIDKLETALSSFEIEEILTRILVKELCLFSRF